MKIGLYGDIMSKYWAVLLLTPLLAFASHSSVDWSELISQHPYTQEDSLTADTELEAAEPTAQIKPNPVQKKPSLSRERTSTRASKRREARRLQATQQENP
jgi:hypothetical protein